jgi:hypothetical protein
MKQRVPEEIPPLAALLRIADVVGMKFELQQVLCDTFGSYVFVNPLPIIRIRLVFMVCALVQARLPMRRMMWPALLRFSGSLPTR